MHAPHRPTFCFDDGALSISTPLTEIRIAWWPTPTAMERTSVDSCWRVSLPEFRLLRPTDPGDPARRVADDKAVAFEAFRSELPGELVALCERFSSHQWALLVLLREYPRVIDWAIGNVMVAYMLANNAAFRDASPNTWLAHAGAQHGRKQREILEWLGFPNSAAAVRLLGKVPVETGVPSILRRLRSAMVADSGILDQLTHLPRLTLGVLELALNLRLSCLTTPALLEEVSSMESELANAGVGDMLMDSLIIIERLAPGRRVEPFGSVRRVEQFHAETVAELQAHRSLLAQARIDARSPREDQNRRRIRNAVAERRAGQRRAKQCCPFPPPPIPATSDIVALTSEAHLELEGAQQRNCVSSYAWRVQTGRFYLYRVMAPERATLAIKMRADGEWHRSELRGPDNRMVRPATARAVDAWLARHSVSVP